MREETVALKYIEENARLIDRELEKIYGQGGRCDSKLFESMKYSLNAGGKRIRPVLALEFCRLFGGDMDTALSFGLAMEMIHTSSLIHDDLPCMDDDDLRRGKPTNHKVFGEGMATIAADGLMFDSFGVAASANTDGEKIKRAIRVLSRASGSSGMVGGQAIDMFGESHELSFNDLMALHRGKTGALIRGSAELGCIASGLDENSNEYRDAIVYAEKIGLAFQVLDDILDVISSEEKLGKKVGMDKSRGKTTFLSFMSVDEAGQYADRLTSDAVSVISKYKGSERLCTIAEYLAHREK